jgi:O-antigen/teichoic acid export membrane protein
MGMADIFNHIISHFGIKATKAKVLSNLMWAIGGKVITLTGNLLVGILIARYLGPEQYGLMSYVISYVTIFQVFASLGLDSIEVREESKEHNKGNRDVLIGTAFRLKVMASVVTMLLIAITTFFADTDGYTQVMIIVYSLSILFNSMNVARNYFTAIIWNEYVVKSEIMRTLIGVGIKVVLLLLHASLTWFILAVLLDVLLLASGYALSYNKKVDSIWLWKWDKLTAGYLLKESFPMMLSGTAVVIYTKINQVMIGLMLDNEAVGQYAIAASFVDICVFVPTILSQTISPILIQKYEQDRKEYEKKLFMFYNITIWTCIFLSVFVSIISYPLIRYTYGTIYLAAVPVLQILTVKVIGEALAQSSGQAIVIESIQRYAIIRNVIGCIVCVGLNFYLIPHYGIIGAAVSSAITAMCPGYLAHLLIPAYRGIFCMQSRSLLVGLKDIFKIKNVIR